MLPRRTSVTTVIQEYYTNASVQLFILHITQMHQCSYSFFTLHKCTSAVIHSLHCTNTPVQLFIFLYTNIFSFTDSTQKAIMYLSKPYSTYIVSLVLH